MMLLTYTWTQWMLCYLHAVAGYVGQHVSDALYFESWADQAYQIP